MPQNIENKEGIRPFLSRIRTSKLVKKGTLGLSALLAAVTIEATSPFLEQIVNQNTSVAYAAEPIEVRYERGFIYAIGEGCSKGTVDIPGKTTIEEATIKAIRDAFEDLGVVYRVDKRELTTKEQIRRETGKQVTSIWTQEMVDRFTTKYPNSYSINRYLYDPEEYYAAHHLEACVRLELRISESDYNSFLGEIQRSRDLEFKTQEELNRIRVNGERTISDLKVYYEEKRLQRQELEEIRKSEISRQEREKREKEAERRLREIDSNIREKTELLNNITTELEKKEKDPEKLKEYRARAEDLLQEDYTTQRKKEGKSLQERAEDDYTQRKKPETKKYYKEGHRIKRYREGGGEGTLVGLASPTLLIPMLASKLESERGGDGIVPYVIQGGLGFAADMCFMITYTTRIDESEEKFLLEDDRLHSRDDNKEYIEEVRKENETTNRVGLGFWGASVLLGIGYDIYAYFHDRGLRESYQSGHLETPSRNYSLNINPLEKKVELTYSFK